MNDLKPIDKETESVRAAAEREKLPSRRKADAEEASHADIYRYCLGLAREAGFPSVSEAIAFASQVKNVESKPT